MRIGAHVSIADGLDKAVARARALRCETFQIFSRSPRNLRIKPLVEEDAQRFRDALKKSGLSRPLIHDNYLINLATPKARMAKLYREAFVDEMNRAQRMNVPYLVFHPGAHIGKGEPYALKRIAASLDWCISKADAPDVTLCLENTAGQGSVIGYKFEQIKEIMDMAGQRGRLGICFDTCHAFAAGYDIRTREGFEEVLGRIDDILGVGSIKAFHLNDSMGDLGSHLDRHEHIGRGKLGVETFRFLMNDSRFTDHSGSIETPDFGRWNSKNLKLLRSLRTA